MSRHHTTSIQLGGISQIKACEILSRHIPWFPDTEIAPITRLFEAVKRYVRALLAPMELDHKWHHQGLQVLHESCLYATEYLFLDSTTFVLWIFLWKYFFLDYHLTNIHNNHSNDKSHGLLCVLSCHHHFVQYGTPPLENWTSIFKSRWIPLTKTTPTPTVPPLGVFLIAGCGADLLINILLTILGCASHQAYNYIPRLLQRGR